MGIVLESIGTTHLTVLDWLRGGIARIAAYVAMLIFTREIRGAQIAYARAKVGEILTGLARAWRRRQPPAAVTAPPGLTGATTGRGDSSPRAAQPPAVAPAGAAASGGRDEFPIEVPMGGGDEAQVPDRLGADGGAKPARSGRLL